MRTPLGPAKSVLIREVSLFQGLNYIVLGQEKVSQLELFLHFRESAFRGPTVHSKSVKPR